MKQLKATFFLFVAPVMVDFWTAIKRAFWAAVAWAYVAAKWVKDQTVELYRKVF